MSNDYEWKCPRSMAGCAAALVRAALPQYRGKHKSKIVRVIRFVELWSQKQWIDPVKLQNMKDDSRKVKHVHTGMRYKYRDVTKEVPFMAINAADIVLATSQGTRFSRLSMILGPQWHLTGLDHSERDIVVGRWIVKDIERALGRRLGNTIRKAVLAAAVVGEYETAAFLVEKAS